MKFQCPYCLNWYADEELVCVYEEKGLLATFGCPECHLYAIDSRRNIYTYHYNSGKQNIYVHRETIFQYIIALRSVKTLSGSWDKRFINGIQYLKPYNGASHLSYVTALQYKSILRVYWKYRKQINTMRANGMNFPEPKEWMGENQEL